MIPVISESVYKIIYDLVAKKNVKEARYLGEELSKAKVVKDEELSHNVVSLYSNVEFVDTAFNNPIRMQIVLPDEANLENKKVSIFAPICVALIGFKENDVFKWNMPSGEKTLQILKVMNS